MIEGADRNTGVTVQLEDDVFRHATVVGEDQNNDLAALTVDMSGVPTVRPLALGDSTTVRVGDPTLAIGNPFGLDRTLTSGIVSALQRQIQAPNGFSIDNVIQTDAPINPGNSGGSRRGVVVHVEPGGPAANAGLKERDAITAVDGHVVAAIAQVQAIVAAGRPGQSVSMQVMGGATRRTLKVVLGSRPALAPR